jgi:DNA polymerase-3 subunit gamma/tau
MSYTVIARRYRSQTFDDVVGQDAVAQTLKNAIEMGRVAHAYLFCGTRGVGKTTMARILAKSMNCLGADGPTVMPCLKCDSCVSVNVGEDIDVIEIDGASNRGIDNIRELIQNAIYRPARARNKIYIIDEVHMLTKEAFNALLKILEEPPEHVKFIFATTEPNKVLATIQSRCQRFDFRSISAELIGRQLEMILKDEKIQFDKDLIIHLSRFANGSMRDALSLLDQLISAAPQPLSSKQLNELVGVPDRQKVMNLLSAIAGHNASQSLDLIGQLIDSGQSAVQICDLLVQNMRDMMVLQSAGADSRVLVLTDDEKTQLLEVAQCFDVAALIYNITTLEKLRWTLRTSETNRALLEASLLRLTLSEHFVGLDQLSAQVAGKRNPRSSVKKKITTPDSIPPTSSARPAALPSAEIASIQKSWKTIAEQCGQTDSSLGAFLVQGRPIGLENSILSVSFNCDGAGQLAKNGCQRKLDSLKSFFSKYFSTDLTLRLETAGDEKKVPEAKHSQVSSNNEAGGVSRQQRQQALNDPAVQMVLKELEATPVEIQKIEIQSGEDDEILIDQEAH